MYFQELQLTPLDSKQQEKVNTFNSLESVTSLVQEDIIAVNQIIIEKMDSKINLIPDLVAHIISSGGKRLRPLLTLLTTKLGGYKGTTRHIGLAASIEFIHTATLLHDDVVDKSSIRRGNLSANSVWGNKASILVGDFLFTRAFELMVEDGSLEVLETLSKASAVIAEGEVMQLMTSNNLSTSKEECFSVIESKTAKLFEAAAHVGGIISEMPPKKLKALISYGNSIGIAFQLIDDALDYNASEKQIGKTPGNDFKEGKITLPIVLAMERGNKKECKFWKRTLEEMNQNIGDFEYAVQLLNSHNAIDDTISEAKKCAIKAQKQLSIFNESSYKDALYYIASLAVNRSS